LGLRRESHGAGNADAGELGKAVPGQSLRFGFARLELPDGAELTQPDVLAANQGIAILEHRATPRPFNSTKRAKSKLDAPFFLALGFGRPHVPLLAASRHFAHYPENKVK